MKLLLLCAFLIGCSSVTAPQPKVLYSGNISVFRDWTWDASHTHLPKFGVHTVKITEDSFEDLSDMPEQDKIPTMAIHDLKMFYADTIYLTATDTSVYGCAKDGSDQFLGYKGE